MDVLEGFPAHIRIEGEQTIEQSVMVHCYNTASYASEYLHAVGLGQTGFLLGLIHDCGKLTMRFSDYIQRAAAGENVRRGSVNHTFSAVKLFLNRYRLGCDDPFRGIAAELLAYAVGAHHVLLVMQQYPDVTVFNSVKGWNALGRGVAGGETGIKVRVSDPYVKDGRTHRGYKVGRVFDITQTTGSRTVSKTVLADDTPQMQLALHALLVKSPVKVNPIRDSSLDAYYDPKRQVIDISETMTDSQTFAALAREIFRARVHDHGRYTGYSREETELDAESASYMLCRSFGVPCRKPDAGRLGALYEGMEPQDARGILDSIQRIFREMQTAVQNEIAPQQEQRRAYTQQTR